MPTPELDFILAPTKTKVSVALEPAQNVLNSMILLTRVEKLSGLADWVVHTRAALSAGQWHTHQLVFIGLHYVIEPHHSWPSFNAYLDNLERENPIVLRDRIFNAYSRIPPLSQQSHWWVMRDDLPPADPAPLLANRAAFLAFLRERFAEDHIFEDVESEAHALLNDPPRMKARIISHLRWLWTAHVQDEWKRVLPMLEACVAAFGQIDLARHTPVEAARLVTGKDPEDWWQPAMEQADQVIFVPSAHLGPYLGKFKANRTLWLLFPARQPQGVSFNLPDLTRSELLVRLLAVADDTRLRILRLIAEQGELRSQDVMRQLDLSQSAASRHLQQLSASGYLTERRRDGAKSYSLNRDRIEDTLEALSWFLLDKRQSRIPERSE